MKIGLLGEAGGDEELLREAVDFMLGDVGAELVVYLGPDDAIVRVTQAWAEESVGGSPTLDAFLDRAARDAPEGDPLALDALLASDRAAERVTAVRRLPQPPARGIELIGGRIVTLVWDKAVLVEEDIANSFFVVYGKSDELLFRRFGPRYFFSPGPLRKRSVGVLEDDGDAIVLGVFSTEGVPILREQLAGRVGAKMMVSS